MKNINNDYTYLARMMSARAREIRQYEKLKKESETIFACTFVLCVDAILAIFAWLVFYA